jgi:hypothetical protein
VSIHPVFFVALPTVPGLHSFFFFLPFKSFLTNDPDTGTQFPPTCAHIVTTTAHMGIAATAACTGIAATACAGIAAPPHTGIAATTAHMGIATTTTCTGIATTPCTGYNFSHSYYLFLLTAIHWTITV